MEKVKENLKKRKRINKPKILDELYKKTSMIANIFVSGQIIFTGFKNKEHLFEIKNEDMKVSRLNEVIL